MRQSLWYTFGMVKIHPPLKAGVRRLKAFQMAVGDILGSIVFSSIYIVILPVFALLAPRRPEPTRTNWRPWSLPSDTLSDVKKQY